MQGKYIFVYLQNLILPAFFPLLIFNPYVFQLPGRVGVVSHEEASLWASGSGRTGRMQNGVLGCSFCPWRLYLAINSLKESY